jgi:hypothetical protein
VLLLRFWQQQEIDGSKGRVFRLSGITTPQSRLPLSVQKPPASRKSRPEVMWTGIATVNDLIRDYTLLRVIVCDATTLAGDQRGTS